MRIGIPKEIHAGERRVAASPDSVKKLVAMGFEVSIETGAGDAACYTDAGFAAQGAKIEADAAALWSCADLVLKVRPPVDSEVDLMREGGSLISFVWPARQKPLLDKLAAKKATVLAMDCIPRISRAQKMDALSSMANISGYRAVIEAARLYGSFMTGQITAAGKVNPAKVLVIGAGVAGLAALGTAKSLGAIVRAFDTRAAVKDQIVSMGGEFLEVKIQEDGEGGGGYAKEMSPAFIEAEMALFAAQAKEVDIVITTALIPNRPAPKLWLDYMVDSMKPGSVVVDLAAENGGNCAYTVPGEVVVKNGVTIFGRTDLTSDLATTASQLYAQNMVHLLTDMGGGTKYHINLEDEAVRGALVLHNGELMWPAPVVQPTPVAAPKPTAAVAAAEPIRAPEMKFKEETLSHPKKVASSSGAASAKTAPLTWVMVGILLIGLLALKFGAGNPDPNAAHGMAIFAERLTVFVLACFVGWQVVWNVTPALHTPLMSVTNAISGIILVGGMLHTAGNTQSAPVILGIVAVLLATINVAGGFLVTRRMLKMFRK